MRKILIIEDEQDIVDISMIILEKAGYEVSSFTEFIGYENAVNKYKPHLVLLDLNLRGHQGKYICKYIKQEEHLKHTKVILMSANPDIEQVKEEVGADGFINKPFDIHEFLEKIRTNIN